jgi:8-oxo-dGTP pyrophosphatase MutT (NUDIX family)
MTTQPPVSGEQPRPHGPRDPGDAWVEAPTGERYWGRFGAAGLLAVDPARGVLLQHRVAWSHFGGTWALPGGARHEGESATDAAIREATEEAGVPEGSVRPRLLGVLDLGYWSYTTLVADVIAPFEPVISDPESLALSWVPVDEIDGYPLHPGFADSWVGLRRLLDVRPVVIVDAANVVGSVPDGWWRDRAGATTRLLDRVSRLAEAGVPATALGLGADRWFPDFVLVREGQARRADAAPESPQIRIADAPGVGDVEVVAQAEAAVRSGGAVTVVTSDQALADRCTAVGATVRSAGWLLDLLSA